MLNLSQKDYFSKSNLIIFIHITNINSPAHTILVVEVIKSVVTPPEPGSQRGGGGKFLFGVQDLDKHYSHAIRPGTIILVAGHPGAGKTTFAAKMCYVNALRGKPCLYVSFNEERDKFLEWMRGLGFDFTELENRGLFKYIKLPVLTEDTLFSDLMDVLVENIHKFKPLIVVIDSITPVSEILGEKGAKVRSFLQNFLTNLSRSIQGVIMLVAEIPLSTEYVSLGSAEFVADIVIIMKHRVEGSRLVRTMELRKVRGVAISVAEIPFAIREGEGIRVFTPPIMRRSTGPDLSKSIKLRCTALKDVLDHIHPGMSLSYITPTSARGPGYLLIPLIDIIMRHRLKVALISYRLTSAELRHYFEEFLRRIGTEFVSEELWKHVVCAEGVNPTTHSLEEVLHKVLDALRKKPNVMILHGVENLFIVYGNPQKTYNSLFNIVQHNKTLGVFTVLLASAVDEQVRNMLSNIADIVVSESYEITAPTGKLHPRTYIWASGSVPRILSYEEVLECLEELKKGFSKCGGAN